MILAAGLAGLVLIFSAMVFYKAAALKVKARFLEEDNINLRNRNNALEERNSLNIQNTERLRAEVDFLNKSLSEFEKNRKDSLESAKIILADLSEKIFETHKKENKEITELSKKHFEERGEKFNKEFERLTGLIGAITKEVEKSRDGVDIIKQSLLSPIGSGKLAEITLGNLLKSSGLREGVDFWLQKGFLSEEGGRLRPDAYIKLPGEDFIIIDAKASRFFMETESDDKLINTMNNHLKSLGSKEYAKNMLAEIEKKENSVGRIITVMFIPTEAALEKISEADPSFWEKASSNDIFLAGPTGLINVLSFAKYRITDRMRAENSQKIIGEIKKLLDSVRILSENAGKVGDDIEKLVKSYDRFAGSFNRNFISRAKKARELGIEIQSPDGNSLRKIKRLDLHKPSLEEAEPLEISEETTAP